MAKTDSTIFESFCKGVEAPLPHWNYNREGNRVLGYDVWRRSKEGCVFQLSSYHAEIGVRYNIGKKKFLLLNGDIMPTATSNRHQISLRRIAKALQPELKYHLAIVPFHSLFLAGIPYQWCIEVVDVTKDRDVEVKKQCTLGKKCPGESPEHMHSRMVHFLGETLFQHSDVFYICGLDRNDDPRRRNFYLTRFPSTVKKLKTVEDALEALRPRGLRPSTPRQGEWFLVPTPKKTPQKNDKIYNSTSCTLYGEPRTMRGVPILSEDPITQKYLFEENEAHVKERLMRHRATAMFLNGGVFVRGTLFDAEHGRYKIGDGKTWHRVVRNLADHSWRGGKVD